MNEAFEKIILQIGELANYNGNAYLDSADVIEIVQEVAEEFATDTNVGTNGWIPCSERLPKYGEVVMCSCTNGGITISCITHKGVTPSKSVRFGQHSVIAWQPLPEPFKERD